MSCLEEYCVIYPKGFKSAGIHIGIKKKKKDFAIIYSEKDCVVSGAFTNNIVKAAPVVYSKKIVKKGLARAVVINSGNANACTGDQGLLDVKKIVDHISKLLNIDSDKILASSTGVIGVNLPMNIIINNIKNCVDKINNNIKNGNDVAEAILTTDTFKKQFI